MTIFTVMAVKNNRPPGKHEIKNNARIVTYHKVTFFPPSKDFFALSPFLFLLSPLRLLKNIYLGALPTASEARTCVHLLFIHGPVKTNELATAGSLDPSFKSRVTLCGFLMPYTLLSFCPLFLTILMIFDGLLVFSPFLVIKLPS